MTTSVTASPSDFANAAARAPETDEALVERLRRGEHDAGDQLAARYAAAIMRYLQRLVGDGHIAEELSQQTWLSVLDHLDRFSASTPAGGFKSWLYRIATNKANDAWRSRSREKNAQHGLRLVSDVSAPDAGELLSDAEQHLKLREAIMQLPEPQRQVLMLRYYSGLKFTEIADLLGCPLNTALGRVHKAILKLKQAMEQ